MLEEEHSLQRRIQQYEQQWKPDYYPEEQAAEPNPLMESLLELFEQDRENNTAT